MLTDNTQAEIHWIRPVFILWSLQGRRQIMVAQRFALFCLAQLLR